MESKKKLDEKPDYKLAAYYNDTLYGLADIERSISRLLRYVDYLDASERQQLIDCCFFAANAHDGQKRHSGEPYICHPIKVAEILAREVRFNLPVLQAGVLHDVVEDTPVEKNEIAAAFSDEVADLVDGVSKLEKDKEVSRQELQARTFTKLVVAMEADPRVVMIKFADRMHNMQTLGALRPDKRRRIAQETLDVYVPIAKRLGMFVFKTELEELVFKNLYPWRYQIVAKLVEKTHPAREAAYEDVCQKLTVRFQSQHIKASIRKRRRNLYEVYQKIAKNRLNRHRLERASIPLIILTESRDECYRVLGEIHDLYTPVFKKLADYIASAKPNGYQSIHTSVLTDERRVINFQIRTKAMHAAAEAGIIAIWHDHNVPKEKSANQDSNSLRREKPMRRWLGNIKKWSITSDDPVEFYESVKRDLIDFEIRVLTPKGEPIALPDGATVIDFAYHVHTELGNHLTDAEVNGVQVPLSYKLSSGQMVELSVSPSAGPHSTWLKYVKTARARTAIRHVLRDLPTEELEAIGYKKIKGYLARRNTHYRQLKKRLTQVAKSRELSLGELLQRIALHDVKRLDIHRQLQTIAHKDGMTPVIVVDVFNQPGVLGAIADTMGRHGANILRIDFAEDMQAEVVTLTFEVRLEILQQLHQIVDDLAQQPIVKTVKYEEKNHEENYFD